MIDEKARAELVEAADARRRALKAYGNTPCGSEAFALQVADAGFVAARDACAPVLPGEWAWDGTTARLVEPDMSVTWVSPLNETVMVERRSGIAAHATPPIVPPAVVYAVREFDKLLRSVS